MIGRTLRTLVACALLGGLLAGVYVWRRDSRRTPPHRDPASVSPEGEVLRRWWPVVLLVSAAPRDRVFPLDGSRRDPRGGLAHLSRALREHLALPALPTLALHAQLADAEAGLFPLDGAEAHARRRAAGAAIVADLPLDLVLDEAGPTPLLRVGGPPDRPPGTANPSPSDSAAAGPGSASPATTGPGTGWSGGPAAQTLERAGWPRVDVRVLGGGARPLPPSPADLRVGVVPAGRSPPTARGPFDLVLVVAPAPGFEPLGPWMMGVPASGENFLRIEVALPRALLGQLRPEPYELAAEAPLREAQRLLRVARDGPTGGLPPERLGPARDLMIDRGLAGLDAGRHKLRMVVTTPRTSAPPEAGSPERARLEDLLAEDRRRYRPVLAAPRGPRPGLGNGTCATCHAQVAEVRRDEHHAGSYQALVDHGGEFSPGCLTCHLGGFDPEGRPGSWSRLAEAPQRGGVGCLDCHAPDPAGRAEHPWGEARGCERCHTPSRSPWFHPFRSRRRASCTELLEDAGYQTMRAKP